MTDYWLYVVTDGELSKLSHMEQAEKAYAGGADVVQLRDKRNSKDNILNEAKQIASIAEEYDRTFIVNDNLEIALASGADGVHLGKCDGSISEARLRTHKGFIIGASVESVDDAIAAEKEGASYVALSPVFDTTTKKDAHHGYGLVILKQIKKSVKIPVIAIGGINHDNVSDVISTGADGVAIVSAIIAQKDIADSAKRMKEIITASRDRR